MKRRGTQNLYIVHITDGSPRDLSDARNAGLETREQYYETRRSELRCALELLGIPETACFELKVVDQEVILDVRLIAKRLGVLIDQLRPTIILTPAYEGGHPDHDATALAMSLLTSSHTSFQHLEYRLYHARSDGGIETQHFHARDQVETIAFTDAESAFKRQLLSCFVSQQHLLQHFPVDNEQVRPARHYDFTRSPLSWPLLYERWGWDLTGERWRELAQQALRRKDAVEAK